MKKFYTTIKYKRINNIKSKKAERRYRRKNKRRSRTTPKKQRHWTYGDNKIVAPIIAPVDFRLLENTNQCVEFFNLIRSSESRSFIPPNIKFVQLDLSNVEKIDYASISVLIAISHYFSEKKIVFRGNFPEDNQCSEFFVQSGFLDFMRDEKGRRFKKSEIASHMRFHNETGRFSEDESRKLSELLRKTSKYLTDEDKTIPPLKSILVEIFGNSVEWSGMSNKMRLVGIYRKDEKVTFTAIDLGKGILSTIKKKFKHILGDFLLNRSSVKVLEQAFYKKYGSSTGEKNRSKGLISVKEAFDTKKIVNLSVITNDAYLNFEDKEKSLSLSNSFRGTLYCWEVTTECINNM